MNKSEYLEVTGNISLDTDWVELLIKKIAISPFKHIHFIFNSRTVPTDKLGLLEEIINYQKLYLKEEIYKNTFQVNSSFINQENILFIKENSNKINILFDEKEDSTKDIQIQFDAVARSTNLLMSNRIKYDISLICNDFIKDDIKKIYLFLKSLKGLNNIYLLFSYNFAKNALSKKTLSLILIEFFDMWFKDLECDFDIKILSILIMKLMNLPSSFCQFSTSCMTNNQKIMIDYEGNIVPCENMNEPNNIIGNVKTNEIVDLFSNNPNKERLDRLREKRNSNCLFCEWYFCCNGGCMNDYDENDRRNYFCSSYHEIFQHIRLVLKELSILNENEDILINSNSINRACSKNIASL
jgi:radical SAM protein with 4Fe4S-binding SPASM domain